MGMFDYVDFETTCPNCGKPLTGFQSKDLSCVLETVKPENVNFFYTSCDNCDTWVEFRRKHGSYRSLCEEDLEKAMELLKRIIVIDEFNLGDFRKEVIAFIINKENRGNIDQFELEYRKLERIKYE